MGGPSHLYDLPLQVKDLEQRLRNLTDSKTSVEEKLKTSEHFVQSLETELQTTRANLEARQAELKECQDRVRNSVEFFLLPPPTLLSLQLPSPLNLAKPPHSLLFTDLTAIALIPFLLTFIPPPSTSNFLPSLPFLLTLGIGPCHSPLPPPFCIAAAVGT